MSVAEAGAGDGKLIEIVGEGRLDTDEPALEERVSVGRINADLSVGTDVTQAVPLRANEGLSNTGMLLAGQGFKLSPNEADELRRSDGASSSEVIRPYVGGRDS
jgi:hypothetical protein